MSVVQRTPVAVQTAGELVVLSMGNMTWSLHFALALRLAMMMVVDGRVARRAAGDFGAKLRAAGRLSDLEAEPTKPSRFAAQPPPPINEVATRVEGTQVQVRLGSVTATLSYEAALQISQWLRVRGREAKNFGGEKAHWATLASA